MIKKLIQRRTPEWVDKFSLEQIECNEGFGCWSYESNGKRVHIKGDSGVSMAVAYYSFLKKYCGAYFAVDHSLVVSEFNMPDEKVEQVINRQYRTCLEYSSFSCAAAWWDWERWENEIDFMAMNGVNLPLTVVGTEAVWQRTMQEMGMSEDYSVADVSGPSFWGWQLSNCLDSYIPQVKKQSLDSRLALGRKIADRERELGMMPIMHGFSGYVSRNYIKSKLRARLKRVDEWFKFLPQYQIYSSDPTFNRIGTLFLKNQKLLLGESRFFLADPFAAHKPIKNKDSFLVGLGTAIYRTMKAQDEDAVWVMHTASFKEPLVRSVPKDNLIIIDNADEYTQTDSFGDRNFIIGTQHNGCDVSALHGDMNGISGKRFDLIANENENLVGVGVFSDGAVCNEAFRQLGYASLAENIDTEKWLQTYAKLRYNTESDKAAQVLENLRKSCWRSGQGRREHASAVCTRPSMLMKHTSIGDSGFDTCYDVSLVFEAARLLCECGGSTYEFELDLCDTLRQALSDLGNSLCMATIDAYRAKNAGEFEKNANLFLTLIEDMDRLMMTKKEFALPYQLSCARNCGSDADEGQNYEINLLSQITVFGPIRDAALYDCCWKEWGGVLKTFYAMRWRAMFELMATSFKGRRLSDKSKNLVFEREEYLGSDFGRKLAQLEKDWVAKYEPDEENVGKESTLDVAKELIEKYAPIFKLHT